MEAKRRATQKEPSQTKTLAKVHRVNDAGERLLRTPASSRRMVRPFLQTLQFPAAMGAISGARCDKNRLDEWPHLLARLQADQFEIIKRSSSGDVLAGDIVLAGRPVSVVIKRTTRRKWYRYFTEIGRGGRARRAWKKAWSLGSRRIPTAWPLLVMKCRTLGYVTDSVIVTERVRGPLLAEIKLDELERRTSAGFVQAAGADLAANGCPRRRPV